MYEEGEKNETLMQNSGEKGKREIKEEGIGTKIMKDIKMIG